MAEVPGIDDGLADAILRHPEIGADPRQEADRHELGRDERRDAERQGEYRALPRWLAHALRLLQRVTSATRTQRPHGRYWVRSVR
jgi:hypothetical protein